MIPMSSSSPKPLFIRTDASSACGTGHFMRCLALAEEANRHGVQVHFLARELPPSLGQRARRLGCTVERVPENLPPGSGEAGFLEDRCGEEPLLLDLPQALRGNLPTLLGERISRFALIDDLGLDAPPACDLLINPNLFAHPGLYPARDPRTRLLTGPGFALIRSEILHTPRHQTPDRPLPQIVLTFGGGDPPNATEHVLHLLSLLPLPPCQLSVVLGAAYPWEDSLAPFSRSFPHPLEILHMPWNLPARLSHADLVLCAGGTTVSELVYLGTPALMGALVPIEFPLLGHLAAHGPFPTAGRWMHCTASSLGELVLPLLEHREARRAISRRTQGLIDGRGPLRILRALDLLQEVEREEGDLALPGQARRSLQR